MRRSLAIPTLALLIITGLLMLAPQAGATARYRCKAKHSELLKKRGYVRVFRLRRDGKDPSGEWWSENDVVVCDGRVGRWFAPYPSDFPSIELIRISGEFVGFQVNSTCGACFGDASTVGVMNAATGRLVFERTRDAETGEGGFDITDMVLEPNGSVAFIAVGNWRSRYVETRTVVRHDCNGTRMLHRSKRIRVHSLKLESGMLRWRSGRRLHTAEIC
jgi:hypothetical protein